MESVKEVFREYEIHKKEIEISLGQIRKAIKPYIDKIVLYGAGSAGIAFLHYLQDAEIFPCYFSDGDSEKHGEMCEGLEIISPASIVERLGKEALVIITINTDGKNYCKDFKKELLKGGHQGVHRSLREYGCNNVIDYTYFRRCYQLFHGEKYNLPACSDVYLMLEKRNEIEKAYAMLSDERARYIFLKILEFRLLSDQIEIPVSPEKGMYFEYDLFERKVDEVFVDCGACGGSSLREFLIANDNQFESYYGIEPDGTNFSKLKQFTSELEVNIQRKIQLYYAAAFENSKGTNFYILNGPGSFRADAGPDFVKTVKIDDILEKKKVSYIKMNIEGSEVSALKGAEFTIRRYFPRLAIMGYHKTSDLWEVPLIIKEYCNNYNLSLKSYMRNVAFAYYAF